MSSNPTCPNCGGWLRWDGAQWLCDRCRVAFPPAQQAHAPAQPPPQPAAPQQPYAQHGSQPYQMPPQQAVPQQHHGQDGSQPYAHPGYGQYPHPAQAAPARSNKKILIIAAAVLVAAGLAVVLIFTLGGGGGDGRGASSPEALAKAAAAALNDKDGDAYANLFPSLDIEPMDCPESKMSDEDKKKRREMFEKQMARIKKAAKKGVAYNDKLKILAVERVEGAGMKVKKGDKIGDGCTATMDFENADFEVAYEYGKGSDTEKREEKMSAAMAGGTWYLSEPWMADMSGITDGDDDDDDDTGDGDGEGGGGTEAQALRELEQFRDRMCACADVTCANAVQAQFMADFAAKYKDFKPSEAGQKKAMEINEQMSRCMMKLAPQ